jgi:hypothetical protein
MRVYLAISSPASRFAGPCCYTTVLLRYPHKEGKEPTGETIAQKRKNVQGVWRDANTRCGGFAKAWVEAMDWTEFTAATQTPSRLIDESNMLVRETPLISCG